MRVLVTGATGFIGAHLGRRLVSGGHTLVSLSRAHIGQPEAAAHFPHDVGSEEPWPEVGPVDAVVHLAAASSGIQAQEDPAGVARANVQGTMHALLFARDAGARFVLASSQRTYRPGPDLLSEDSPQEPADLYGCTKIAAELYTRMAAHLYGVPAAIVRPFSVYGPGQLISRGTSGVVSILAQRALAGEPLTLMSRHPKDFVDVTDVAEGIMLALAACQSPPRSYNIATGVPVTVIELARLLQAVTVSTSPIIEDYSHDESGGLVADISRARRELGYEPRVRLEEGLRTYVSWLQRARPDPAQSPPDVRTAG